MSCSFRPFSLFFLVSVLFHLNACQESAELQQKRLLDQIAAQQKALVPFAEQEGIPGEEQQKLSIALIEQCEAYLEKWPEDSSCGRLAFLAAIQLESLGKVKEAIAMYDRIPSNYPEHRLAGTAWFRTGFLCETVLQDLSQARERYTAFAAAYPQHPLAQNMELQLQYLGNDEALLNAVLQQRDTVVPTP